MGAKQRKEITVYSGLSARCPLGKRGSLLGTHKKVARGGKEFSLRSFLAVCLVPFLRSEPESGRDLGQCRHEVGLAFLFRQ